MKTHLRNTKPYLLFVVHCEFGDWGNWTSCDRQCGGGTQFRTREVKTYARFGGEVCAGDAKELQACNLNPCPGKKIYVWK